MNSTLLDLHTCFRVLMTPWRDSTESSSTCASAEVCCICFDASAQSGTQLAGVVWCGLATVMEYPVADFMSPLISLPSKDILILWMNQSKTREWFIKHCNFSSNIWFETVRLQNSLTAASKVQCLTSSTSNTNIFWRFCQTSAPVYVHVQQLLCLSHNPVRYRVFLNPCAALIAHTIYSTWLLLRRGTQKEKASHEAKIHKIFCRMGLTPWCLMWHTSNQNLERYWREGRTLLLSISLHGCGPALPLLSPDQEHNLFVLRAAFTGLCDDYLPIQKGCAIGIQKMI